MRQYLPRETDFLQQAENNRHFEGVLPIGELVRIHDVLNSTDGDVRVTLDFGWKYGIRSLSGTVDAELELICQRCLNPMKTGVTGKFCFALITDADDIANVPDDMEPYIIEGVKQSVDDVVTDELLLSIPLVAKHDEECSEYIQEHDEVVETDTYKPFASIKDLLK